MIKVLSLAFYCFMAFGIALIVYEGIKGPYTVATKILDKVLGERK